MDASPFDKLSAEIRNMIYEHALRVPIPIVLEADGLCTKITSRSVRASVNALTQTCRAIRLETTKMFYALNDFTISCNDTFRIRKEIKPDLLPTGVVSDVLCTFDEEALFCRIIGPQNTAALRSIELRVRLTSLLDVRLWGASVLNLHFRKRDVHSGFWKITFIRPASDTNPRAGAVCFSLDIGRTFTYNCERWTERLEEDRTEDAPMRLANLREQFAFWRSAALDEKKWSEKVELNGPSRTKEMRRACRPMCWFDFRSSIGMSGIEDVERETEDFGSEGAKDKKRETKGHGKYCVLCAGGRNGKRIEASLNVHEQRSNDRCALPT